MFRRIKCLHYIPRNALSNEPFPSYVEEALIAAAKTKKYSSPYWINVYNMTSNRGKMSDLDILKVTSQEGAEAVCVPCPHPRRDLVAIDDLPSDKKEKILKKYAPPPVGSQSPPGMGRVLCLDGWKVLPLKTTSTSSSWVDVETLKAWKWPVPSPIKGSVEPSEPTKYLHISQTSDPARVELLVGMKGNKGFAEFATD